MPNPISEFKYVGSELELFSAVHNWKTYWSNRIAPFIHGDTLEVGAGIGANTPFLDRCGKGRWVCLEPDADLIAQLHSKLEQAHPRCKYEIICGTLANISADQFDTIIYIDVLEHIENDREELASAVKHLRKGGRIIVLSPAHQRLFTPFDTAIGHFRRYNRRMLREISPPETKLEQLWYLDSAGLLLSSANLLLLRQSMPTKAQLAFWDRCVIPVSRVLDPCLCGNVGKSIVGIWRRDTA